jgi:hypothetical protein
VQLHIVTGSAADDVTGKMLDIVMGEMVDTANGKKDRLVMVKMADIINGKLALESGRCVLVSNLVNGKMALENGRMAMDLMTGKMDLMTDKRDQRRSRSRGRQWPSQRLSMGQSCPCGKAVQQSPVQWRRKRPSSEQRWRKSSRTMATAGASS